MSSKGRLTKSALFSAALHLAAAAVLFSKPLHLHPRFWIQIGKTPSIFLEEEDSAILKKNRALEEAFSQFEAASSTPPAVPSHVVKNFEAEIEAELDSLSPLELAFPEFSQEAILMPSPPAFKEEAITLLQPPALSAFNPRIADPFIAFPEKDRDLSDYAIPLPAQSSAQEPPASFDFIPSEETTRSVQLSSPEMPAAESLACLDPMMGAPAVCEAPSEKLPTAVSDFTITLIQPSLIARQQRIASLGEYGLPSLHLKEWNEFFDVDVKTIVHEEEGFLFSVSLTPKQDLSEYRIKQNYLFMIDRSNSIDKHRYQVFKRAVVRALSALREGDKFNIILLDASITQLSEKTLPFSRANQQRAEEFLEKQSHGYYGAATDIYSTLIKMSSPIEDPQEAITAILISDGDSPLKSSQQRKKINHWLEANQDRITLYTATAGYGNNLSSLKMLGLASRGSLLYSDTHAAFPRKLAKLVMDLRYPIAKEMTMSLITSDPSARLELLPPSSRLPYLFSDHPFTLMGRCNKLTDFILILEGKNKDQVLTIKKSILLSKAKPGSRLLTKQWASEKAHTLFDQYLSEGQPSLLEQAEKELGNDAQNHRR